MKTKIKKETKPIHLDASLMDAMALLALVENTSTKALVESAMKEWIQKNQFPATLSVGDFEIKIKKSA